MKSEPYLIPMTNIDSKGIKDMNIRTDSIKLLEVNIGKNLLDNDLGDGYLNVTPKEQATKLKNKKVSLYQTKIVSS